MSRSDDDRTAISLCAFLAVVGIILAVGLALVWVGSGPADHGPYPNPTLTPPSTYG